MWKRATTVLGPVVVSLAKMMGVGATVIMWGPRSDGAIHVDRWVIDVLHFNAFRLLLITFWVQHELHRAWFVHKKRYYGVRSCCLRGHA